MYSKLGITRRAGDQKDVRVIRNLELVQCFLRMGERKESLGELYDICDNSSYNCSNYAESTVFVNFRSYAVVLRTVSHSKYFIRILFIRLPIR